MVTGIIIGTLFALIALPVSIICEQRRIDRARAAMEAARAAERQARAEARLAARRKTDDIAARRAAADAAARAAREAEREADRRRSGLIYADSRDLTVVYGCIRK